MEHEGTGRNHAPACVAFFASSSFSPADSLPGRKENDNGDYPEVSNGSRSLLLRYTFRVFSSPLFFLLPLLASVKFRRIQHRFLHRAIIVTSVQHFSLGVSQRVLSLSCTRGLISYI